MENYIFIVDVVSVVWLLTINWLFNCLKSLMPKEACYKCPIVIKVGKKSKGIFVKF